MTPEETNKYIEKMFEELYDNLILQANDIPYLKQAIKDTWNEALTQAEGVLPGSMLETKTPESYYMFAQGHNTCLEQSKSAISKLKLK